MRLCPIFPSKELQVWLFCVPDDAVQAVVCVEVVEARPFFDGDMIGM